MNAKVGFALVLLAGTVFHYWVGCSKDAAIRNSVDAARAVCCLAHIREGQTPEAAEVACKTLAAVSPYIVPAEKAAAEPEVTDGGRPDARTVDSDGG